MKIIPIAPQINNIIGKGGFHKGHLLEIFGADGGGKTTLAILAMCSAQQMGEKVGYLELEYLDREHAEYFGLDLDNVDIRRPETAEETFTNLIEMQEAGYGLIIVDSVAGMVTEEQSEREVGEGGQYAPIATFLAKEISRINRLARLNNNCVIFTNQIRSNIQKFGMGADTKPYGGYALGHFVSARFEVRRVSWIKSSDKVIGFKMRIRAPHKNRFAPPNREGYLDIIFDSTVTDFEKLNKRRKTKIEPISFKTV